MRILLIDDEPDILEQAKIFLQREVESLTVEAVTSAEKGLDLLEEDGFDAIVSDYQMPEIDGLEFLKIVREEKNSEIPFIIFTGKGREDVAMDALNLGADRYLQKGGDPRSQYGVLAQAIVQEVKHAKTKLEKAKVEAELSSLVKGSEDSIYIVDEDCRIVFANQAELEKTGMDFKEIIGTKFHGFHPEEDAEYFEEKVKKALETGEPQRQEVKHEGTGRYYIRTFSPIKNPRTGEVDRVSVISKDISERKKHEELWGNVFDRIPVMITIYDPDMEEFHVNEEFEQVIGWTDEEIEDIDLMEKCYPDPEYREMVREYMKSATVDWRDFEVTAKDGSKVESSWSNIILSDDRKVGIGIDKTKLKEKERELQESRRKYKNLANRFKSLFEAASDGAAFVDENGVIGEVNQAACESLECSKEDLVGLPLIEQPFYSGVERERFLERAKKVFEGEDVPPTTYELETMKGNKRYIEMNNAIIKEDGKFKGLIMIGRDLTERKKAEEKFEKFFENLGDAVFVTKLGGEDHGVILEVNPAAVEETGYSEEELIGMDIHDLIVGVEQEKTLRHEERLENGETVVYSNQKRRKDGSEYWDEVTISPINYGDGKAALGINHNITERKNAEEELEQYKKVVEGSEDLIAAVDEDYNYIFVNEKFLVYHQIDREEIIGRTVGEVVGEEIFKETIKPKLDKCLEGETVRYEMDYTYPGGRKTYLDVLYQPLEENGEVYGAVAVMRDITKRVETEERDEFLHSLLRHDIKNKANIIQGYHELLQDFELPEEAKKYVERADATVRNSVEMVEKVRTLLEVEKGKVEKVSASSVIDTGVVKNRNRASEKGIRIDLEKPDCKVRGGSLLEELFSNLLENAIRHSGCDKIRIYGREREDECIVTVEDDGCGISDADKEKIFDRGFREGKSSGSGLGLYLVKEIAESYGGTVQVKDSELGGARFDVRLKKA